MYPSSGMYEDYLMLLTVHFPVEKIDKAEVAAFVKTIYRECGSNKMEAYARFHGLRSDHWIVKIYFILSNDLYDDRYAIEKAYISLIPFAYLPERIRDNYSEPNGEGLPDDLSDEIIEAIRLVAETIPDDGTRQQILAAIGVNPINPIRWLGLYGPFEGIKSFEYEINDTGEKSACLIKPGNIDDVSYAIEFKRQAVTKSFFTDSPSYYDEDTKCRKPIGYVLPLTHDEVFVRGGRKNMSSILINSDVYIDQHEIDKIMELCSSNQIKVQRISFKTIGLDARSSQDELDYFLF